MIINLFLILSYHHDHVLAHTNSVCYVNSGPGSVTFWYGSWHAGTNFTEGELKLTGHGGTSYGPTIVEFTSVVQSTPSGCLPGTNYFNTNGTDLIPYGSNTSINWQSYAWQGVTFSSLAVGSYNFEYIPVGHAESKFSGSPTADWEPVSGIKSAAVTLDSSSIGNTVSLSSTVPSDDTTELNLTVRRVELIFDQVVNIGTGVIKLIKTATDTVVESLDVTDSKVTGGGTNTIIAQWTNALEHSTNYCIQIDNTALKATDGTSYSGISDKTTLDFTTMGLPYLTSSIPADNELGISVATQSLKLGFNEAINSNSGNISVIETSSGQNFEIFDVTGSNIKGWGTNEITLEFSKSFPVSSHYHVLIDSNAIKNAGSAFYAGITDKTTLNFSTSNEGIVTLTSSDPKDDATDVSFNNRKLVLNFSHNLVSGNGTIKLFSKFDEKLVYTADINGEETSILENTVTVIWPDWLKPNTDYFVNIDGTAFTNSDGQKYPGINNQTTLNFKTSSQIASPWDDPDVHAMIEAQAELVERRLYQSIRPIMNRLRWFRANGHKRYRSIHKMQIDIVQPEWQSLASSPAIDALGAIEDEFFEVIKGNISLESAPFENDWAVWSDGEAVIGKVGQQKHSSFKHFHSEGLTLGFDKKIDSSSLVGIALRAGNNNTEIGLRGTHIDSVDYGVAFYKTWSFSDRYFIDFILGGNQFNLKTHREVGFGNTIIGKRNAYQGYQSVSLHRELATNFETLLITPYSRFDVGYTNLRPFNETGGNAAISFEEQHVRHARANLGLHLNYRFTAGEMEIRPYSRLEYSLDMSNSSIVSASYILVPDSLFHSKIHNLRSSNWKYGLGFDVRLIDGWIAASYERIEESEDRNDHQVSKKSDSIRFNLIFNF